MGRDNPDSMLVHETDFPNRTPIWIVARAGRAGLLLAGALACSAAAHAELLGVDGGGPSGGAGASGPGLAGQPGNGPAPGLGGDRTMPRPGGNGGAGGGAGAWRRQQVIHYGGGGGGGDSGGGGGIAIIDPMGAAGGNGGGVAQALSAGADLNPVAAARATTAAP